LGFANSLWNEQHLALGKCSQHERGQVSIFTQQQKIFLVERVNHGFGVVGNNVGIGDNGYPAALLFWWDTFNKYMIRIDFWRF
jgi:hypothetical protein